MARDHSRRVKAGQTSARATVCQIGRSAAFTAGRRRRRGLMTTQSQATLEREEAAMSDNHTVFDKILSGEIPCHRVHEDEHTFAFLDIAPVSPGHTLVIPKQPRAFLHELDDEYAAAIGRVLPRLARAVLAATGADAY